MKNLLKSALCLGVLFSGVTAIGEKSNSWRKKSPSIFPIADLCIIQHGKDGIKSNRCVPVKIEKWFAEEWEKYSFDQQDQDSEQVKYSEDIKVKLDNVERIEMLFHGFDSFDEWLLYDAIEKNNLHLLDEKSFADQLSIHFSDWISELKENQWLKPSDLRLLLSYEGISGYRSDYSQLEMDCSSDCSNDPFPEFVYVFKRWVQGLIEEGEVRIKVENPRYLANDLSDGFADWVYVVLEPYYQNTSILEEIIDYAEFKHERKSSKAEKNQEEEELSGEPASVLFSALPALDLCSKLYQDFYANERIIRSNQCMLVIDDFVKDLIYFPDQAFDVSVGQEINVLDTQWVHIVRAIENQYSNGVSMLEKGESCLIEYEHKLQILGFSPSGESALVKDISENENLGTPCPRGAMFFLPTEELAEFESRYILEQEKERAAN